MRSSNKTRADTQSRQRVCGDANEAERPASAGVQLLAEDWRSVSEKAPLQDRFRKRGRRSTVEIVRIEIGFRRDRQNVNTIEKHHQFNDDVLELWRRIVRLCCLRKVFAADRGIARRVLLLLMPRMMIRTMFVCRFGSSGQVTTLRCVGGSDHRSCAMVRGK